MGESLVRVLESGGWFCVACRCRLLLSLLLLLLFVFVVVVVVDISWQKRAKYTLTNADVKRHSRENLRPAAALLAWVPHAQPTVVLSVFPIHLLTSLRPSQGVVLLPHTPLMLQPSPNSTYPSISRPRMPRRPQACGRAWARCAPCPRGCCWRSSGRRSLRTSRAPVAEPPIRT